MKKGNGVRFTYPIVAPDFTGLKKVSGTISQGEKKKKSVRDNSDASTRVALID